MGLFDKVGTDGTGSTGLFVQQAAAFGKMDLNTLFKMGGQGVSDLITNAAAFFKDVFGHSNCNDQDRVLVERFMEQVPGMAILLSELGYLDSSIGQSIIDNPNNIYSFMKLGRPKGAEPCNSLIYPARLLFTMLFGVRILNSNFLDALEVGPDAYYASGGSWLDDIPRNAVDRAVMLRQSFFPGSTYNTQQWDLNKFQEYPLVAPVPDPMTPGTLYTGEFLGVKIVNGLVIGDLVPDIGTYTMLLRDRLRLHNTSGTTSIIDINTLPAIPSAVVPGNTTLPNSTNTNTNIIASGLAWAKSHPIESIGLIALCAIVVTELIDDK